MLEGGKLLISFNDDFITKLMKRGNHKTSATNQWEMWPNPTLADWGGVSANCKNYRVTGIFCHILLRQVTKINKIGPFLLNAVPQERTLISAHE